eukprot:CAMPEP_0177759400 /NCGR_PEP_ID=MMETSP0491_2-20121128/4713_1 /TAXON_ID=63592 /ORGANISM="Tetraselmis chuii, Strain PLY429" /LENGTH=89 /DNA_ID=CAMNT_0019275229 /DNA_START=166 /DNA_END=435 /DNA_ORIENTATION=+
MGPSSEISCSKQMPSRSPNMLAMKYGQENEKNDGGCADHVGANLICITIAMDKLVHCMVSRSPLRIAFHRHRESKQSRTIEAAFQYIGR